MGWLACYTLRHVPLPPLILRLFRLFSPFFGLCFWKTQLPSLSRWTERERGRKYSRHISGLTNVVGTQRESRFYALALPLCSLSLPCPSELRFLTAFSRF